MPMLRARSRLFSFITPLCISIVLIVILTASVYAPVLKQGFFNWDDPKHVKAVWKPSWERAWRICTDFDLQYTEVAYYIPLHFLSLMADQALLGNADRPQAWISKLTNVCLHTANATLVFALLLAFGTGPLAALFGALVFAVHPMQVGTVAWVVERKNVLSTFFYLSALLAFIRFGRTGSGGLGAGVVILFAAGLLSKPSVVTLPVMMLAGVTLFALPEASKKKAWVVMAAVFAMAAAWSVYVIRTEVSYPGILPDWYLRPLLAARVTWFYLAAFVLPHDLVVIYPRWDVAHHVEEFLAFFVALAIVAGLAVFAHLRYRLDRVALWGMIFFLVNILPVCGLAPFGYMGHSFVADHFMYLPLVGLAVVVARCAHHAFVAVQDRPVLSVALYFAAIAIVAVFAVLSAYQVRLWKDPALLWEATLNVNKRSTAAYMNYGSICMQRGELDKALELFRRAAELSPKFVAPYNNMGRILMSQGRRDDARQMFEKSLEVNPKGVVPRVMLARMLVEEHKPAEALKFLQQSVELAPNNATLRTQLANAYRLSGRETLALYELDRAIELEPLDPAPYVAKADVLMTQGEVDEAVALLQKALERQGTAEAHNMLGVALAQKGNISRALEEFQSAFRLNPALAGVQDNIANALVDLNELGKAKEFCAAAQKTRSPCSRETRQRIDKALESKEKPSP